MITEQTVSLPQKAMLRSNSNINLLLLGVGSGKTHFIGIKSYQFIKYFPKVRGFIGANTYLQLQQSTLFRVREYWKSIGVIEYDKVSRPHGQYVVSKKPPPHFNTENHSFDEYYGIISFINGAVIFIGSMDHAEAHEGKEFGYAFLDETKDTDESDVKEIIVARIRQKGMYLVGGKIKDSGTQDQQYNPLFVTTSPAKTDWINTWFSLEKYIDEISAKIYSDKTFFEKELDNKMVVIGSTYHNVQNVGVNYINTVLAENTEERGKSLIYANPFAVTGGEFYSSFSRLSHVKKTPYISELALHITFDQNSVPYNSATIWQVRKIDEIWECRCIDEIALENPHNSTEEVCDEFAERYKSHKDGGYYYGDASGRNRTTMNKDFKHHYQIVESVLRRFWNNSSNRTCFSNPSIDKRRDFINMLFDGKYPIRIIIDEKCTYMIADLMYLKQDIDGTKKKQIVKDKVTGDKYQKYGHLSDGMDYFLTELFQGYYQVFINKYNG